MRKAFLSILIALSVPLFLFANVLQAERYMMDYFEVRGLITTQEDLVQNNKRLINRVAELESPTRIFEIVDTENELEKVNSIDVVRLEVVDGNE